MRFSRGFILFKASEEDILKKTEGRIFRIKLRRQRRMPDSGKLQLWPNTSALGRPLKITQRLSGIGIKINDL